MNPLIIIPLFLKYSGVIDWIWTQATSNDDFIKKFELLLPTVARTSNQIASEYFPGHAPMVAKFMSSVLLFNVRLVKYAQQACNALLPGDGPPLEVDGMYGPKTDAAVRKLQRQLGLTTDGIFGKLTEAAVKRLLPTLVI